MFRNQVRLGFYKSQTDTLKKTKVTKHFFLEQTFRRRISKIFWKAKTFGKNVLLYLE